MTMRIVCFVSLTMCLGLVWGQQRCDVTQFPLSAPTERFHDNSDGTVTDSMSGLMWMRCGVGQEWKNGDCVGDLKALDWRAAQSEADRVNGEGSFFFSDWRVPSLRDLAMIIERQCQDPRTNLTVFPGTPPQSFWTVTVRPGDEATDTAYALSFGPEGVERMSKDELNFVRLVRTAQ